jgi:hypothetical protein
MQHRTGSPDASRPFRHTGHTAREQYDAPMSMMLLGP